MAELRLGVDPRPAEEGLKRYTDATEKAIGSTERLSRTVATYEQGLRNRLGASDIAAATAEYDRLFGTVERGSVSLQRMGQLHAQAIAMDDQRTRRMALMHTEALRMNAAFDAMGTRSVRATGGVGRLNDALFTMLRTSTGLNPVVSRTADLLLTFGLGTAVSTGIIAGITGIALAWREVTEESREAKERLEEAIAAARKAQDLEILPLGGEAAVTRGALQTELRQVEAGLARINRLRGDPSRVLPFIYQRRVEATETEYAQLIARQSELRGLVGVMGREAAGEEIATLTERLRAIGRVRPTDLSGAIAADQAAFEREMRRRSFEVDIAGGFDLYGVRAGPGSGVAAGIGQQQYEEQQRRAQEAAERELQLIRDRERAYDALTRGLYEVGQAYGGATGQALALTAALIDMSRAGPLPMESFEDQARGYGAAGLYGIGVGTSTGNYALGGAGGAAAGWMMTGNPYGAIVGGVAGIVSGLIESGHRAEEAARIWRLALEDYDLMFDDLTPQEADRRANERRFMEMTGGRTVAEVEEILGRYQGRESPFNQNLIDAWREALRIYYENNEQIENNTDAVRALNNSLTSVLNAPSGFRLSLYEWLGTAGGPPNSWDMAPTDIGMGLPPNVPGGGGIRIENLTVNVPDAGNPRATAMAVVNELQRMAKLGGPDPLTLYDR